MDFGAKWYMQSDRHFWEASREPAIIGNFLRSTKFEPTEQSTAL